MTNQKVVQSVEPATNLPKHQLYLIVIQLNHNHLQKHAETMCSAKSATYEQNVKNKNKNKRWKWRGIPLNFRQQQIQYIAELQNEKAG